MGMLHILAIGSNADTWGEAGVDPPAEESPPPSGRKGYVQGAVPKSGAGKVQSVSARGGERWFWVQKTTPRLLTVGRVE